MKSYIPPTKKSPKFPKQGSYKIIRKPNAPPLPRGKQNMMDTYVHGVRDMFNSQGRPVARAAIRYPKWVGEYFAQYYAVLPVTKPRPPKPFPLKDREKMPAKKIISNQTFKLASQHHKKTAAKTQADALKKQGYNVRVYRDPTASSFNWALYRRKRKKYFSRG